MPEISYQNFDLLVANEGEGYRARLLSSPAGEDSVYFKLPFSPEELSELLRNLSELPTADAETISDETIKQFGGALFNSVFQGAVAECLRSSLDRAAEKGCGLRIRLRLKDVPELASLPWEYLYNPGRNRFLGLSIDTPIVRYLDLAEGIRTTSVQPPLRLLVMISSPGDYATLDVEREWSRLTEALDPLEQRGLVALERMEDPTLAGLQNRLRRGGCHILHFIGHGDFDQRTREGMLVLEDEQGCGRLVSGSNLGTLLRDEREMSLVVLNSCEGSRASTSDVFSGMAQSLVQFGIPAVIAMQFQITDTAAVTFSREFYAAVADGYPVDAALAEARKAIFGQGNKVEWGTPVLLMRSSDGRIFDVGEVSEDQRTRVRSGALFRDAGLLSAREEWSAAIEKLQSLLALQPGNAEAKSLLRKCRTRLDMKLLYTAGREHFQNRRWRSALDDLIRARNLGAANDDLDEMIRRAQTEDRSDPHRPDPLEAHYSMVIKALFDGRVVPFLGKCANLCGRPAEARWQTGKYPPTGEELAEHLASTFEYPASEARDLLRVSQYVSVMTGSGPLYDELHSLFDADYRPTPLHEFFANLPSLLLARGAPHPYQLLVTTNYDDVLEKAFAEASQQFDLVSYIAEGENAGKFLHRPPDGDGHVIEKENEWRGLSLERRSVILKIHGAVDRFNPDQDSYVITEDHNIDYLTRTNVATPVPMTLLAKLKRSQFLFFGSSLRDWNLRVFLHRVWGAQKLSYKSWAIQPEPHAVDRDFWRRRDVDIVEVRAEEYVNALSERLATRPLGAGGST